MQTATRSPGASVAENDPAIRATRSASAAKVRVTDSELTAGRCGKRRATSKKVLARFMVRERTVCRSRGVVKAGRTARRANVGLLPAATCSGRSWKRRRVPLPLLNVFAVAFEKPKRSTQVGAATAQGPHRALDHMR